jgi:hypothetical protein
MPADRKLRRRYSSVPPQNPASLSLLGWGCAASFSLWRALDANLKAESSFSICRLYAEAHQRIASFSFCFQPQLDEAARSFRQRGQVRLLVGLCHDCCAQHGRRTESHHGRNARSWPPRNRLFETTCPFHVAALTSADLLLLEVARFPQVIGQHLFNQ